MAKNDRRDQLVKQFVSRHDPDRRGRPARVGRRFTNPREQREFEGLMRGVQSGRIKLPSRP